MKPVVAVDLFCGAGGMTHGLRRAGLPVSVGVDIDPSCRYPIERNNAGTTFVQRSVTDLTAVELSAMFPANAVRVLVGCAPCQPFSKYSIRATKDERWQLLHDFLRLVQQTRPDAVSMENVPQLIDNGSTVYRHLVSGLDELGYCVTAQVVRCAEYGVPQTRERLVLLAGAQGRKISLLPPTTPDSPTVRATIGSLPPIAHDAGPHPDDNLHTASRLSQMNLARIRATPEGGSWHDWPASLRLSCHKRSSGRYYGSVYGRMKWDSPAPTITTQCFGYGNGRFGHPQQDRAITLREAALLQTFPPSYEFVPAGTRPTFLGVGRQIGNAVPVALAEGIGKSILRAFEAARV